MDRRAWAFAGITIVFWASAFAAIRAGLAGLTPGHLVLLRFLVASGVMAVYASLRRLRPPRAKDLPRFGLLGLLGFFVYHTALVYGERTVLAGSASLLIASGPVFTALLSRVFLGERLGPWGVLGTGLAFLGVALIALGEGGGLSLDPGAPLIVLSALSASLYFVFQKPLFSRYTAEQVSVYTLILGSLPFWVFSPGFLSALARAGTGPLWSTVYLGVFPGALAYFTWTQALSRAPASVVSSLLYLSPVLATLIAWVWLGEWPAPLVFAGGALALLGVVLVQRFNQS